LIVDWFVYCLRLRLQHDNLVPTMTSWESLSFYAGIILPPQTSAEKKRKRIQEVLEMMGLAHARDTLVRTAKPLGSLQAIAVSVAVSGGTAHSLDKAVMVTEA
jgi:hypothetical protein